MQPNNIQILSLSNSFTEKGSVIKEYKVHH